jgi:hypothetical protein
MHLTALAVLVLFAINAQASLPLGWTSVRALGMGNAYTAVVDNSDAIFYNPAGMARVNGIHWTIMNPRVGLGNPANISAASGVTSSGDIGEKVSNLYGKPIWAGGGGLSAITVPYFGAAAYANTEAGINTSQPPYPRMDLNYYFDYGGAIALAADFIPGFFALGTTVRYINRTGTTNTLGPATFANLDQDALVNELKRRGTGVGVDFGMVMRFPGPVSPSASFVYRNAGQTVFQKTEGIGAPPNIPSEMIAGVGLTVSLPFISITPAVDFRYIGWTGVATGLNINAGVELSLPLIDIRAGISQGYYTAGLGVDIGFIEAGVATWAQELGAYPGQEPDRRYMAQLTMQLGLDFASLFGGKGGSGGSGGGGGGEGRRIKRRR